MTSKYFEHGSNQIHELDNFYSSRKKYFLISDTSGKHVEYNDMWTVWIHVVSLI